MIQQHSFYTYLHILNAQDTIIKLNAQIYLLFAMCTRVLNSIILIVVAILFSIVLALFFWNNYWGRRAVTSFIAQYPDTQLRTARDGQFVKIYIRGKLYIRKYWLLSVFIV